MAQPQFLYPFPAGYNPPVTQTFAEHEAKAKSKGWCTRPSPCPGGVYYYGGIDYGGVFPVVPSAPGKVSKIKMESAGYGHVVYVQHTSSVLSLYGHLKPGTINVAAGAMVDRNTQLGISDNTGFSSGNHLHWEFRVDGIPVDPDLMMQGQIPTPPPDIPPTDALELQRQFKEQLAELTMPTLIRMEVISTTLNLRSRPVPTPETFIRTLRAGQPIEVINFGTDINGDVWARAVVENSVGYCALIYQINPPWVKLV